jgi:hypothetical protein
LLLVSNQLSFEGLHDPLTLISLFSVIDLGDSIHDFPSTEPAHVQLEWDIVIHVIPKVAIAHPFEEIVDRVLPLNACAFLHAAHD